MANSKKEKFIKTLIINLIRKRLQKRVSGIDVIFVKAKGKIEIHVWVELTGTGAQTSILEKIDQIQVDLKAILEIEPFMFGTFNIFGAGKIPLTDIALLRAVKIFQPVMPEKLCMGLEEKGFLVKDLTWLAHQLDKLRKKGLICKDGEGLYAVTTEGLKTVPISKSKISSDIERCLELGKRRW